MNENNYEIKANEKILHDITSIVELVDSIISYAYHRNTSDIHIDPTPLGIVVRFRIDGVLQYIDTLSKTIHDEMIARIKVISGLRTDIHFVPQDGRFNFNRVLCDCDIRVSID
jgi:type II secretory ATPase GspE/PulE/Tfp pilus assembly ATPase PilB-like protein